MKSDYYDGTRLLSLSDINGYKPEIYISTSNRTAGKTTYFNRLCVNKYKNRKEKFALIVRYSNELDGIGDKFFKDINDLFFQHDELTSKIQNKGTYAELYLNGEDCGYALPLNGADKIKKCSHLFNDVKRMLFDEFQSESNDYCPNEIKKFQSVHTSVARGKGEMVRYVPVYLVSNLVTLLNPYYVAMGISSRLNSKVKYLRGDGFVLEQGFNEAASNKQKESAFNRAFAGTEYALFNNQGVYLNDSSTFIETVKGIGRYVCTLKYEDSNYCIREYPDQGIVYCDNSADLTYPVKISITTDDHDINYVMLRSNDLIINTMRYYFDHGCFRFKNLSCKNVILKMLSY